MHSISPLLQTWQTRINHALDACLPRADSAPQALHQAMRHSVLLGGKRMRPLLVYATGQAFSADLSTLDAAAVAVELIHAYSLVHDDLPAMDDDALRRGQPTVHIAFDEATAILAGDALQSLAFEVLSQPSTLAPQQQLAMLAELAQAAGAAGMCGGQALDIAATGQPHAVDIAALTHLHACKTGALLRASVRLGALAAGADAHSRQCLDDYANALGLAFQIRDDILDVEADSATLGKTAGKDAAQNKATFPALIGLDASKARLAALAEQMQHALHAITADTRVLAALAKQVIERSH